MNDRIQVLAFDRDGQMQFRRAFGGPGEAPGQFSGPCGVAVVHVLVLVSEEKRLQVLTPAGAPLQVVPLGQMLGGICALDDRVCVADFGACQVHALKVSSLANRERVFRTRRRALLRRESVGGMLRPVMPDQ